jgi:DUF971 family protein
MAVTPVPTKIKLHRRSQVLELVYDHARFELPAEFLRVYSPSAEVKGHGRGQEVLQSGKQGVAITDIEAQGNYAIKLVFSDGHDSGIYSWQYLQDLGSNYQAKWRDYLLRLEQAGKTRDPEVGVVRIIE